MIIFLFGQVLSTRRGGGGNPSGPPCFFPLAMPGSFNLISENYQDISDSELAGLDLDDTSHASYAQATARGISSDDHHDDNHNDDDDHNDDADHNDDHNEDDNVRRAHLGQHRTLSDFERENFHPLNVTPDRPCTAFFRPSEQ